MNKDISISHYTKCRCYSHTLEVERYVWHWESNDGIDDVEDGFNFAIWSLGFDGKLSWLERIRWCWEIITKGRAQADSIIVTNEDACKIAKFIQQNIPNERSNKDNQENENKETLNRNCGSNIGYPDGPCQGFEY